MSNVYSKSRDLDSQTLQTNDFIVLLHNLLGKWLTISMNELHWLEPTALQTFLFFCTICMHQNKKCSKVFSTTSWHPVIKMLFVFTDLALTSVVCRVSCSFPSGHTSEYLMTTGTWLGYFWYSAWVLRGLMKEITYSHRVFSGDCGLWRGWIRKEEVPILCNGESLNIQEDREGTPYLNLGVPGHWTSSTIDALRREST